MTETINRQSLEAQAADLLRRQILGGELPAGERLLEIPIADRLGLSRGTIRAALRRLIEEGLVCHIPYTGYQVIEFADHDLWELYTLRGALESLATRLAALSIDGHGSGQLRAAFAQLLAAAEAEDHERADRLDRELHKLIVRLSGHERLLQHYVRVENQFRVYIALSNREVDAREICESHRELVESICAGDAERAERLARANIVPPDQIPARGE
ncbi:MAG TPA: GntR family transcriptional regulator [Steroidobacteraceae bacterium]|jgi:DNA-binding GntR family transcriptional regulator|nr:GntR family transcriptional regulator [Steroidobacteraceae bacterium]